MITYHVPIVLSSAPEAGARNKSDNGSSFEIYLEKPILIPKEAKYCWIVCQAAEIFNLSPNIQTGVNDRLYLTDGSGALQIVIPQGLYDIPLLNSEIDRQIVASGRTTGALIIEGNDATQKTRLLIRDPSTIDFTQSDTFRDILGFNSQIVTTVSANEIVDADNVARFNPIDFYVMHTDLVTRGLRINDRWDQAVAQILLEAPPGNQIIYQPDNPAEIPANNLIGDRHSLINVWVTDQNGVRIDTAGENYSMRLVIYYII